MSPFFLFGVEKAADSGGRFIAGLRTVDGEACAAPCDLRFRDGDETGELGIVERVRRLVGVGSSAF